MFHISLTPQRSRKAVFPLNNIQVTILVISNGCLWMWNCGIHSGEYGGRGSFNWPSATFGEGGKIIELHGTHVLGGKATAELLFTEECLEAIIDMWYVNSACA